MVVAGLDSCNQRIERIGAADAAGASTPGSQALVPAGRRRSARAKVQLGSDSEVALVAPRNLAVTIPAGHAVEGQHQIKIRYQGPVKAPIAKGQHIADLVVTTADTAPQVMPLVAGEAVGEAGFFGRIWIGFKQLFGMA